MSSSALVMNRLAPWDTLWELDPAYLDSFRAEHRGLTMQAIADAFDSDALRPRRPAYNVLRDAAKDESIRGIMLRIDSPGGTVSGIDGVCGAIEHIRKAKPVAAFIAGVAAGSAYRVASSCSPVFASLSSLIGALGCAQVAIDWWSADPWELLDDSDAEEDALRIGADLNDVILRQIQSRRSIRITDLAELASGATRNAEQCEAMRLIDSICTFDVAVDRLSRGDVSGANDADA